MSSQTNISWCDSTFNPWLGCTKVSRACDHCYAERLMDHRMHKVQWGVGQPRKRTSAANWRLPLRWNGKSFMQCEDCGWRGEADAAVVGCGACGSIELSNTRRRVFCASLADVFDNEAPIEWLVDLLDLIRTTPHLDWLLLTKRVGNAEKMLRRARDAIAFDAQRDLWLWITDWYRECNAPPNVWLGATVVNQEDADRDIPKLLAVPAAKRFLSIEPMLGGIWLPPFLWPHCERHKGTLAADGSCDVCEGRGIWDDGGGGLAANDKAETRRGVDWIIAGGESGPNARPMHPDWVRSLRDQCAAAGVPFHFKQWGEHAPNWLNDDNGQKIAGSEWIERMGVKIAGRQLDGIEHNGVPS